MKKNVWNLRILTAILLFPLLFINVKDSHDWGDDFAQYLIQARNIVEGRPQTENGLLQNEKDPAYAIEAYPVGLPILISPVYFFYGLDIFPYCILFSIILFLSGLLSFEFFRKRTNGFIALLITLLFCYNPGILDIKKQILSEIPFICLTFITLLWVENFSQKKYSWLITGIIFTLLISVRLAGIAVFAGYIIFEIVKYIKVSPDLRKKNYKKLLFTIMVTSGFFLLLNALLFPIKAGGLFDFYAGAFRSHELQLENNLTFYYRVSEYIFPFYGSWIPSPWIIIALTGWSIKAFTSATFLEFVFPLYILLVLLYPYANAGLRFLLPVLPFLIYYTGYLVYRVFYAAGKKAHWASAALFIILLTAYISPARGIIKSQSFIEDGPQQEAAVQLFNYLKTTPADAAIVFCKARAMSLYSGRSALYTAKNQTPEDAFFQFHRHRNLFLVIGKVSNDNEIFDMKLTDFISKFRDQYQQVWENEHFRVYKQVK